MHLQHATHWPTPWIESQPQRRLVRLSQPRVQLQLPLYLLLVSLFFASLLALNTYAAFGTLYEVTLSLVPGTYEILIQDQLVFFAIVTLVISVAWGIVITVVSVAYLYRMISSDIPMQRHVRELRNGNFRSRVVLRGGGSASCQLARDLNELAIALEGHAGISNLDTAPADA
jgi:hypothetical protein